MGQLGDLRSLFSNTAKRPRGRAIDGTSPYQKPLRQSAAFDNPMGGLVERNHDMVDQNTAKGKLKSPVNLFLRDSMFPRFPCIDRSGGIWE